MIGYGKETKRKRGAKNSEAGEMSRTLETMSGKYQTPHSAELAPGKLETLKALPKEEIANVTATKSLSEPLARCRWPLSGLSHFGAATG
jgi:hypothetical protein